MKSDVKEVHVLVNSRMEKMSERLEQALETIRMLQNRVEDLGGPPAPSSTENGL